jgi:hypothetical protein
MQIPNSSCGSPCGAFQRCLVGSPKTPRRLFEGDDKANNLFSSPPKKPKMDTGRAPISGGSPPELLRKKKPIGPIEGLLVKQDCLTPIITKKLGEGSFGTVFQVHLPGNELPFAMKVIDIVSGGRSSPSDVRKEASNYSSPKCIPGVGMSSPDGKTYYGFSSIAKPLDKFPITFQNIEKVIDLTKAAVMNGPFSVVLDTCPENIGFISAGTPTPVLGENRLLCAGSPVQDDEVVFIDLGNADTPNDCNPKYSALFDEEAMDSDEAKLKYRRFKCNMMSALLRNRLLPEPRNEYDIVREICNSEPYGYTYAAGDRR